MHPYYLTAVLFKLESKEVEDHKIIVGSVHFKTKIRRILRHRLVYVRRRSIFIDN